MKGIENTTGKENNPVPVQLRFTFCFVLFVTDPEKNASFITEISVCIVYSEQIVKDSILVFFLATDNVEKKVTFIKNRDVFFMHDLDYT